MGKSIRCSSCGAEIKPRWGQNEVKCPICGGVLSVIQEQKRMEMTDSNRINVIRYEAGNDMLVISILFKILHTEHNLSSMNRKRQFSLKMDKH